MAQPVGYARNSDLPKDVRASLDEDAQDVYRVAYNASMANGRDLLACVHDAWATVGRGWLPERGKWIKRKEVVL